MSMMAFRPCWLVGRQKTCFFDCTGLGLQMSERPPLVEKLNDSDYLQAKSILKP